MLDRDRTTNAPASLIQSNISLCDKNWFGTGGPAQFFAQPKTGQEFQHALQFARTETQPLFLLGEGANILIADDGFAGLVIKPNLTSITQVGENDTTITIRVGSGLSMHELIVWCLDNAIIGLEEFSGIPGTVGGSVYINLHYFEFLLSQFLVEGEIIHKKTGAIETVPANWFAFGYNQSTLLKADHFLVSATFQLKKATEKETAYARGRHTEIIRHRKQRYPNTGTCGSFFRNFTPDEVTIESTGKKMIYVAYYLDKIGIKGELTFGGAQVSYKHANMLVNNGTATSEDIITLARTMQEMVREKFNITPQPECRLVGFNHYPLL